MLKNSEWQTGELMAVLRERNGCERFVNLSMHDDCKRMVPTTETNVDAVNGYK